MQGITYQSRQVANRTRSARDCEVGRWAPESGFLCKLSREERREQVGNHRDAMQLHESRSCKTKNG